MGATSASTVSEIVPCFEICMIMFFFSGKVGVSTWLVKHVIFLHPRDRHPGRGGLIVFVLGLIFAPGYSYTLTILSLYTHLFLGDDRIFSRMAGWKADHDCHKSITTLRDPQLRYYTEGLWTTASQLHMRVRILRCGVSIYFRSANVNKRIGIVVSVEKTRNGHQLQTNRCGDFFKKPESGRGPFRSPFASYAAWCMPLISIPHRNTNQYFLPRYAFPRRKARHTLLSDKPDLFPCRSRRKVFDSRTMATQTITSETASLQPYVHPEESKEPCKSISNNNSLFFSAYLMAK